MNRDEFNTKIQDLEQLGELGEDYWGGISAIQKTYIESLEAQLAAARGRNAPAEWKPGDEGWFWCVEPFGFSFFVWISKGRIEFKGVYPEVEEKIKEGWKFYRAVLPEVE